MTDTPDSSKPVFDSATFLKTLPAKPGVYQMLNHDGKVIYVGKAKSLKNRVSNYFRSRGLDSKTVNLVRRIADIQVTVTRSEVEALLLEQNLIKEYKPHYNILFRDDKSFPYVYLSSHQKYPRLSFYRGKVKEKGRYFGPYPSSGAVRESLSFLQKVFKVRQCEDSYFRNRSRPCLQHQINRCTAPCVDLIDEDTYAEDVNDTVLFLEGKSQTLLKNLASKMEAHSQALEFEEAAQARDKITNLQTIQQSQFIESGANTLDVFAIAEESGKSCVHVIYIRDGRVQGSRSYYQRTNLNEDSAQILNTFISQFYLLANRDIPQQVITSLALADAALLEEALSQQAERKITLLHQVRSHRLQWLQMAERTAQQNLASHIADKQHMHQRLQTLQEILALPEIPERLECFDISHSSGEKTVASCVVFNKEGALKSDYRRFNIENITAGDDYAAMEQALTRRFKKWLESDAVTNENTLAASDSQESSAISVKNVGTTNSETLDETNNTDNANKNKKAWALPDVLVIDGGKGQFNQAKRVLAELNIPAVTLIGIAKGRTRKAGFETLIVGDDAREMTLDSRSPALHILQQIRDEAHRFAITGHKNRRDKARKTSRLECIPGVGAKRRRELLNHFGGLQGVMNATVDELMKVPSIHATLAEQIHRALHT